MGIPLPDQRQHAMPRRCFQFLLPTEHPPDGECRNERTACHRAADSRGRLDLPPAPAPGRSSHLVVRYSAGSMHRFRTDSSDTAVPRSDVVTSRTMRPRGQPPPPTGTMTSIQDPRHPVLHYLTTHRTNRCGQQPPGFLNRQMPVRCVHRTAFAVPPGCLHLVASLQTTCIPDCATN